MNGRAHLDAERWRRFLAGQVAGEERAQIVAHLGEPCETCDEALALMHERDGLDGITDDALTSILEPRELDELGFQRVERAMRRRSWLPAVFAAAAAIVALILFLPPGEDHARLKGEGLAPNVHLEVLRVAGSAIEPIAAESKVAQGATIVFRVTLDEPGCIELWRESTARVALLDGPACFPAGAHVLESGGTPLGLTLRDEGAVTIKASVRREGTGTPGTDQIRLLVEAAENEVP